MADQETLPFPFELKELKPEEKVILKKTSPLFDYVRVGPKGFLLHQPYQKDAANIYNMPLRSSDIFVASYQRSGTTWTQELVWLLTTNLDYAGAEAVPLTRRYSFLDQFMFFKEDMMDEYVAHSDPTAQNSETIRNILQFLATPATRFLATAPSPRFIKTHLPMSLLPPKVLDTAKVVYVARDPRDVAVSCYHHSKLFKVMDFPGEFKEFWNLFFKDLFLLTPYFEHVKEAWEKRNHPNMLFLFYEELVKDLPASVRRVSDFLGKQLSTEDMARLCDHLKFENFKNNKSVNYEELRDLNLLSKNETFIRKGKAGGWRDYFDAEMTQQAEQWIADNLSDTDLRFPHLGQFDKMGKENDDAALKIVDVEPEEAKKLMGYFHGEVTGFVRVGPKGYFFPQKYKQEATKLYTMPIRPDDVFVTSYPRSGTTWTQELVWMVANDLDYEKSNAIPLTERYPFLEFSICVHPELLKKFTEENSHDEKKLEQLKWVCQPGTDQLANLPSPRFIKSHLPLSLLPPTLLDTAKMVYVARDPRDVVVSFYHLNRLIRTQGYVGDFKTYWGFFRRDLHHWAPYFEHLKEAWEKRHNPNMLFLFYEELCKDLPGAVRRVTKFFDKDYTEEQIARLCDHLSFENFKNNKSVNYDIVKILGILIPGEQSFIRKGKAGGWRDYFDEEMTSEAECWMAENLKDTDLRFPHLEQ